jgi:hypothetical protein
VRPLARALLGALACAGPTACGDALGLEDVLGVWNTQSINGYAVPGDVVYLGATYDTEYVRWTFYEGGLCTLTQLVDGVTATYDECEYSVDVAGKAITIVFLGQVWDGDVDRNTMTVTDPQDIVWILRPQ